MSLTWDLARAEILAHRGTFSALAMALALAVATGGLALSLVDGVQSAVSAQVRDTIVGDVRVTRGPFELGGGRVDDRLEDFARSLDEDAGVRLELEGILSNGSVESGSGVMLMGITEDDPLPLPDAMVQGVIPSGARVFIEGRAFVPVVVGTPMLAQLDARVYPGSGPMQGSMRLNVTAGHLTISGGRLLPIAFPAVVVGAYETGFRILDRTLVFLPIEAARELINEHPGGSAANALAFSTEHADAVADIARSRGYNVTTPEAFQRSFLGAVYDAVVGAVAFMVVLLLLVGAGWTASATATQIAHDARRLATLLAVGLPHSLLRRSWLLTALAVGAVGGIAGALVAVLVIVALGSVPVPLGRGRTLEVFVDVQVLELAALALIALVVALVATRLALLRLDRIDVVGTLKGG